MVEIRNVEGFLQIFNIDRKKDLERYCRDFVIYSCDLVFMILATQRGVFAPYRYANRFIDRVPSHLQPSEEEHKAIRNAKVGPLEGKSQKFVKKMFQLFEDRRVLAAHLFYTPSYNYWHLFYFDQRDCSLNENHWEHGPHIHFISSLWPNLDFEDVWNKVKNGNTKFPSIHIRYYDVRMKED